ncbi:MAG TPA: N-acetylmuramoyl-L-alanine amidase [Candidatus Blautia stercorigallinarum]|mgnify:FL=1|uniref:N-acetylmuramoyl-L-alanine amidase n=1 Tax=Candidatus Blautia stercorigallinarum TaxID=2838501 RepID=A0A9D1PD49_9FIRM|nr:N-acetylmuramoyl-L-alanine amidase [Candidatus Blautia stercorigallinarum]
MKKQEYKERCEKAKAERKKRRKKVRIQKITIFGAALLTACLIAVGGNRIGAAIEERRLLEARNESFVGAPPFDVELLDVNEYSRPGIPLEQINGIVIHYTANPGSTAQNNRDYFEGLKDSHETKVSSHFVVGIEGEIVQCIPSSEIAYASNSRNSDTLSIECCHPDETGKFTDATYTSLVRLTGWLCYRFNLTSEDVIRHYDVTGKICPKYYVDHPEAWEQFKTDVGEQIKVVEQEVLAGEGE